MMNEIPRHVTKPKLALVATQHARETSCWGKEEQLLSESQREDGRLESQKKQPSCPRLDSRSCYTEEGKGKGLTAIWTNSLAGPKHHPVTVAFFGEELEQGPIAACMNGCYRLHLPPPPILLLLFSH